MAEQILPQHRPHEQLRTEAPAQKKHSDKYVSAFVSSDNQVDMTFTNPLLQDSADHYKVGVDELTVNLSNLSMLEYSDVADVLFRIRRLGIDNEPRPTDAAFMPTAELRTAATFTIDRAFLTIHEVLDRFSSIANAISSYMHETGLVQPGNGAPNIWRLPLAANAPSRVDDFCNVSITANGAIRFRGNRHFWANFVLEVPLEKYRYLLLGNADTQYLSVHPATGALITAPYTDVANPLTVAFDDWGNVDTGAWAQEAELPTQRSATGNINILHTLDRRVTLEVGCSLPLKNSPMVDHGVEAPDYVLGRYMMHEPYTMSRVGDAVTVTVPYVGTVGMQGPKDRIVYHHLNPQQKIQTLRLRLWARVRTYNTTEKTWGMKTIMCPVQGSDYWHIRLHFVPK